MDRLDENAENSAENNNRKMTVDQGGSIQELNDLALGAADMTMEESAVTPHELDREANNEPPSPDPNLL